MRAPLDTVEAMSVIQASEAVTALETRDVGARVTDILVTDFHLNAPMLLIPTEEGLTHYWLLGPRGQRRNTEDKPTQLSVIRHDPHQGTPFQLDGLKLVARATNDHALAIVEDDTNDPLQDPFIGHTDSITDIAVIATPSGRTWLATASADSTVRLWDPEAGQPWGPPLVGHDGAVTRVVPIHFPDQRILLATAGEDHTVRLWPMPTETADHP